MQVLVELAGRFDENWAERSAANVPAGAVNQEDEIWSRLGGRQRFPFSQDALLESCACVFGGLLSVCVDRRYLRMVG